MAVVVVVAVITALLVVQPWSGDDSAGGDGGTTGSTGTEGSSGSTGSPGPTDGAGQAVRGDLDGDGRGDVLGRFNGDSEQRLTLTNADGSFEVAREGVAEEEHLVVADFDGDGSNDIGSWTDDSGTLRLEVPDTALPALAQDFELWFKVQQVNAVFGDFDGDGLVDVAAYGQQHRSQVSVWVLHNNGAGFDPPQKWASLPNATYGSTVLIPGDFNGDGSDDVLAVVPDQPLAAGEFDDYYWYGDFGVVPLLAEPDTFGRGGITTVDTQLYDQEYAVGDFDGDGKDTLVADDYLNSSFVLYEYDGDGLRPTGATLDYSISGDGVMDALAVADLDGDRRDDLVFTSVDVDDYSFFGAWVASADGSGGLAAPQKWSDLPDCPTDYCEVDYFPSA